MIVNAIPYTGPLYNHQTSKSAATETKPDGLVLSSLAAGAKSATDLERATALRADQVQRVLTSLQAGGLVRMTDNRYLLANSGAATQC